MGKAIKIEGLANNPHEQGKELKSIFAELTNINDEAIALLQKTHKQNVQLRKIIKAYRYVLLLNVLLWVIFALYSGS